MGFWSSLFQTSDPETGESVDAKVHVNNDGHVDGLIYNLNVDDDGGRHGHVWGLASDNDNDIGGRDTTPPPSK